MLFLLLGTKVFAQDPADVYHIGSLITNEDGSQGIVFWLSPDGTGGWMCALNDLDNTYKWSTQNVNIPGFPNTQTGSGNSWSAAAQILSDTAGYSHTTSLRNYGNASTYPAAFAVDYANGWYLPSIGQLMVLFNNQYIINSNLTAHGGSALHAGSSYFYWSSSYSSQQMAYAIGCQRGEYSSKAKSTTCYIRPIRSFSINREEFDQGTTVLWSTGDTSVNINISPTTTTSYQVTTITEEGCTDTASYTVFVKKKSASEFSAEACYSYNWNGQEYTSSGDYTNHFINAEGCDSLVTLHLTINDTIHTVLVDSACYFYTWNDSTYEATGIYTQHFTSFHGCDSVVTLHLTINNPQSQHFTATACESYTWTTGTGETYTESGVYQHSHLDAHGCWQVDWLHLNILLPDTVYFNETVCQGQSYTGHGFNIPADSTTYPHIIVETFHETSLQNGCDSCTILTLTVTPVDTVRFAEEICQGESYVGHGFNIPADSTTYPHIIVETFHETSLQYGCDSCTILTLTVNPVDTVRFADQICQGQSYTGHGFNIPADSTTYRHIIVETFHETSLQNGCDSCTILTLTVNPVDTVRFTEQICQGEPYTGHGFNIPADSTTYPHVIVETFHETSLQNGCDSIIILTLTVNPFDTVRFAEQICQGEPYTGHGFNIPADSTTYPHVIVETFHETSLQNGCDSIIILTLTVNRTAHQGVELTVCDEYIWADSTYTQSGTYTRNFQTSQGCDSTVTLQLTVNHSTTQHFADTVCQGEPYVGHGFNIPADSTAYPHTIVGTFHETSLRTGCDSCTILTLTVNPAETVTFTEQVCQGQPYIGHGFNIPADSTTYPHTIVGTFHETSLRTGCDSTTTLTLIVTAPISRQWSATSCNSYTWNGTTYTQSGNYTQTFTAASGCDSVVTLYLTIHHPAHHSEALTACGSYTWTTGNGQTYTSSGTYTHSHTDSHGCTQVDTLRLTIVHPVHQSQTISACESYTWTSGTGNTYTESGTYIHSHTDAHYCTQVDTLHLTINHADTVRFADEICQGEPYTEHGFNIPADSTTYSHIIVETVCTPSLQTGCDSCTILTLRIMPAYDLTFEEQVCQGDPYEGHGFSITSAQTQTPGIITETHELVCQETGCDSTVTLNLNVIEESVSIMGPTEDFCETYTALLEAQSPLSHFLWSTGETTQSITVTKSGTYTVTASEGNCSASTEYVIQACETDFFLPNSFTPSNEDGINDVFCLSERLQNQITDFEIYIYSRWGELVYESKDEGFKWDGKYNGHLQVGNTFVYIILYKNHLGQKFMQKGSVLVL